MTDKGNIACSYSAILLRKRPRKRLDAIRHPLKLILLFARNLLHHISRTVVIAIAPLDLRRVEIDLHICAVHILRCAGGKAAKSGDQADELFDVVAGFG
jgi:hypothetical protein